MKCVCVVVLGGLFRCGMEHGAGKAMLMRDGACAAELRLMGLSVFLGCSIARWATCLFLRVSFFLLYVLTMR